MVVRFDRSALTAKAVTESTGRPRLLDGVVARTHDVGDGLNYVSGPEYRDLSELERMVAQLPGLPVVTYDQVTPETPPSHPSDLLANGAPYHQIGVVMDAWIEDGKLNARIYFHDKGALDAIDDGINELSLGYQCTLDENRFQRNIKLDHLSVVWRARCGATCALRTDAAEGSACPCLARSVPDAKPVPMQVGEMSMNLKLTLDPESEKVLNTLKTLSTAEAEVVVPAEPKADHADCTCNSRAMLHTTEESIMDAAEIQKKLDDALAEIATLKASAEKTELEFNQAKLDLKKAEADLVAKTAEIASVKTDAEAQVEAAKAARTDADNAAFLSAVDARVNLLADAAKVEVETVKVDGDKTVPLTDREIKVAIVKKVDEMDIEDSRSADYVNGMYAGAMKRHTKAAESVAEVRAAIVQNHDNAVEVATTDVAKAEEAVRKAAQDKRANRWR